MRPSILIVEDDKSWRNRLRAALAAGKNPDRPDGYDIHSIDVSDGIGSEAIRRCSGHGFDVVLLDIELSPDPRQLSGIEVCARLRRENFKGGIIMITIMGGDAATEKGLMAGADHYVEKCKPNQSDLSWGAVLRARVEAVLRWNYHGPGEIRCGDLVLFVASHTAEKAGGVISLTRKEWDLLATLMNRPNQVFTRPVILEKVWGPDGKYDVTEQVVDTHVARVRKKIGSGTIRTVINVGYKINCVIEEASQPGRAASPGEGVEATEESG